MEEIKISIVVPLYNEEAVFDKLIQRISNVINQTNFSCEVILINDGSRDRTPLLIEQLCKKDKRFTGVLLSRNHGHQLAVTAGLN
ncbi:glycosyltransferase, partial [Flavobacterium sp.]|uniref:glycosyltransferase n=1 Tax=Flavobacterium sp. TaxID=239 RepID=UPI00352724EC